MAASDLATFTRNGAAIDARLTRRLAYPAARIWTQMTDAARLAEWLAPGQIEPRVGGRVRLDFEGSGSVIDSEVAAFEPGSLLAFSWSAPGEPSRPVRWELAPKGDATSLTIVVTTPKGEDPGRACAGWEAHLEMLAAALAGSPIPFPFKTFKAAREAYRARAAEL